MDIRKVIDGQRERRRFRVRRRIRGSATQPRMSIHRTLVNFGCQLVDDATGRTLVSATTREKEFRSNSKYGGNCEAAKSLGKLVAERALNAGITQVAFDRGHCKYHGRVAAFADAAREAGLKF